MPVNLQSELKADIKAEKTELRRSIKDSRTKLDREKKLDYDADIQSRVLTLRSYHEASVIFTYVSMENEPSTLGIIHAAWANGKRVAVPKCEKDSSEMTFYLIKSMSDLAPGYYGILEPDTEKCERIDDYSHGLCVVPGLSFDAEGYRLGYGRGYYDRFLKQFRGTSVGLCYSSCVKWKLPRSDYDVPVDMISTERYLRNT